MAQNTRKRLQALYDKIPSFDCIPGCTDCCGPTPWADAERKPVEAGALFRGADFKNSPLGTLLVNGRSDGCLQCPFANNGCDVHSHRPFMCRLFGAVENFRCPHGCGPDRLLTKQEGAELTREYHTILADEENDRG